MTPLVNTLVDYVAIDMLFASPWCPCCGGIPGKNETGRGGTLPASRCNPTSDRQAIVPESSHLLVSEQETDLYLEVVDDVFWSLPVVDVRRIGARPWLRVR